MLVGCSSVEPSNTMNTAVIYLKQDYENGAATVARINLAMVKSVRISKKSSKMENTLQM